MNREETTFLAVIVCAVGFVACIGLACITSGTLTPGTPRLDATPDAQWIPVVDPGFDAGAGGRP